MDRLHAHNVLQGLIVPLWVRVFVLHVTLGSLRLHRVPTIVRHALLDTMQTLWAPQLAGRVLLESTPKISNLSNAKIVMWAELPLLRHSLRIAQSVLLVSSLAVSRHSLVGTVRLEISMGMRVDRKSVV